MLCHQRTAQGTGDLLLEEISRKQSLLVTGTATSCIEWSCPDEGRWSECHMKSFLGSLALTEGTRKLCSLLAAQCRLSAETDPSEFGVLRQLEADFGSKFT
jgi:hypothetical protein